MLDDIFCRSSDEELEVEYVSLIEKVICYLYTNCTFKWHSVFWVTIDSNTNLHLTLIYLFNVARGTFRAILASETHWLQPMLVLSVRWWPAPTGVGRVLVFPSPTGYMLCELFEVYSRDFPNMIGDISQVLNFNRAFLKLNRLICN